MNTRLLSVIEKYELDLATFLINNAGSNEVDFAKSRIVELDKEIEQSSFGLKDNAERIVQKVLSELKSEIKENPKFYSSSTGLSDNELKEHYKRRFSRAIEGEESRIKICGQLKTFYESKIAKFKDQGEGSITRSTSHKLRYLYSLGIIDYLKGLSSDGLGVSNSTLAKVLQEITGSKAETLKRGLNAIDSNEGNSSQNPIKHEQELEKTLNNIRTLNLNPPK